MLNVIKKVLLTFLLNVCIAYPAQAGGYNYSDFSQDIRYIVGSILDKCKADGIGSSSDKLSFRKTCGEAMHGRYFIGFDDNVFYKRQKTENGFRDIIGAEILSYDGKTDYSLVRSIITEVQRPHNEPEKITKYADATLFVKHQGRWQAVWHFVNPHTNDWRKVNPMFPKQQGLSPEVAKTADRLWREYVVQGTAKIAFNIKDATGPIFTGE